jgi:uncharacterized protein (DUF2249 family)
MAATVREPVRSDWKVSDALARYPQLLQVLIDLSPAFGHLRNPLARTLRTRLVSVAQAARIAGMQPNELVHCLNEAAGLEAPVEVDHAVTRDCAMSRWPGSDVREELDVRSLLERGEEPFSIIMAAAARVPEGGALRLRASFEPEPLYEVLARRGFSHASRVNAADDWEVVFTRGESSNLQASGRARASGGPGVAQPVTESVTGEVVCLDVSDLVPPEPMVRILEAASRLKPRQTLSVDHHRRPVYLYPQLDAQGFVHETHEIGPGHIRILIRRAEV